jgi:hypothetical protein
VGEPTAGDGNVVPTIAYDAVGVQTVVIRLAVRGDPAAVAAELPAPPLIDVHVVAGRFDVFAVGRFDDRIALNALLADLSADPRVTTVTADTVLRTVREHDASGLVHAGAGPD